jgi:hypothetical protein
MPYQWGEEDHYYGNGQTHNWLIIVLLAEQAFDTFHPETYTIIL